MLPQPVMAMVGAASIILRFMSSFPPVFFPRLWRVLVADFYGCLVCCAMSIWVMGTPLSRREVADKCCW